MIVLYFVLYLLALVCFAIGAFGSPRVPHVNLVALGLVFLAVVWVIQTGMTL